MPPTAEQQRIIDHDPLHNGRVLAGPGTGKSRTCIDLVRRLKNDDPNLGVRLITFTRAASSELAEQLDDPQLSQIKPATIHSFALSILLNNTERARLPLPLRIADGWEIDKLIRSNIARRIRKLGFKSVTKKTIEKLEREMSAQWESLNPDLELLSQMDPHVRNAYVGLWDIHRTIYGYTLLAELPFRAGNLIEDFGFGLDDLDLLVIDEYQDLNKADIRLIHQINEHDVSILAIGDDDQSIYSFRMAAPEGILSFPEEFLQCDDYELTVSWRCGRTILDAATSMIETVPGRIRKPPLRQLDDNITGTFSYIRFQNQLHEAAGVADIVQSRISDGVQPGKIAVLVRSRVNDWADILLPELEARNINVVDTERIMSFLNDPLIRKKISQMRLIVDPTDSLAWWSLLFLENGISQPFRDYIFDQAKNNNQSFGDTLLSLSPNFDDAPTRVSANNTNKLISRIQALISEIDLDEMELGEIGWADWVIEFIGNENLNDDIIEIIHYAGQSIPADKDLGYFLGNLEPLARDFATRSNAVKLMSMSSSKGITVNTCIVMGVEDGIIPHPRGTIEEERRLLYVAMTRATDMCILTYSHFRQGPTARHGTPNVNEPRGRSPLLEALPIGQFQDGTVFLNNL